MPSDPMFSHLSSPRQRLLRLMQRVNFGRIEGLVVRHGEPVLSPPPRVVSERKFASESGPRPECALDEFALKAQHVELLQMLDHVGDGVIGQVTFKNGLPFSAEMVG